MLLRALLLFAIVRPMPGTALAPPTEPAGPDGAPALRDPSTTVHEVAPARLATRHVVVRLAPDAGWTASEEAWARPDLMSLLTPAPHDWPEAGVDPLLDELYEGLHGDDDVVFLAMAREEGLLDVAPSDYDDEWTRFAALWAMYAEASERAEWFLAADDVVALHEEVTLSLERAPEGPTSDALRVAWLVLADARSDEPLVDPGPAAALSYSPDPSLAAIGLLATTGQESVAAADILHHPALDGGDLAPLITALERTTEQQAWAEAAVLAERVARHPDADDALRAEASALLASWASWAHEGPWGALAEAARSCAEVDAGDQASFRLRDGRLHARDDSPLGWCLDGEPVDAVDQDVTVLLSR